MENFLNELAERKYSLYYSLYIGGTPIYTNNDCLKRIEVDAKYNEVIRTINGLPLEHQIVVNERFEEIKGK